MQDNVINLGNPVNRAAPLNRGLAMWLLCTQQLSGGLMVPDLCARNPATLTNGAKRSGRRIRPYGFGSLEFDSIDDYANCAHINNTLLTNTPGFAVSGWFIPNTIDGNWHGVIRKGDTSTNTNRQFWVTVGGGYSTTTNGLSLFTNSAGDGAVGTAPLTAGRAYFFLASHYGTGSGGNALWIWSKESGWETATAGGAGASSTQIDADPGSSNVMRLSQHTVGTPLTLSGLVDDIRFYTIAKHTIGDARQMLAASRTGYQQELNWLNQPWLTGVPAAVGGNRRRRVLLGSH
jgi:hypothetical protein